MIVIINNLISFHKRFFIPGHRINISSLEYDLFCCFIIFAFAGHHTGSHIINPQIIKLFGSIIIGRNADSFERHSHHFTVSSCLLVSSPQHHLNCSCSHTYCRIGTRCHPESSFCIPLPCSICKHLVRFPRSHIIHPGFHPRVHFILSERQRRENH